MSEIVRAAEMSETAAFPVNYEGAKQALAVCERIDECKEWADKGLALASYARQAGDDALMLHATRIKLRAARRGGELLKQIDKSKGGRPPKEEQITRGGVSPSLSDGPTSRTNAAAKAGLSPDQKKTFQRVASVPKDSFEEQVESAHPPTLTDLAAQGTKPKPEPEPHPIAAAINRLGIDPKAFHAGMHVGGEIEINAKFYLQYKVQDAADGMLPGNKPRVAAALDVLINYLTELRGKL